MQPRPKPPLTAGAYLLLSRMRVLREKHGTEWCKKWGVGAIRRDLEKDLASLAVVPIGGTAELPDPAQGQALSIAISECRKCQGCKLGRE